MGSDIRAIYHFDSFTLDLIRGVLLASDATELPLRPKSFALLRYMVANAERLVDRDELMQAVWPGVFVTDDSIAQCIKDIRRALGDETQRLVRTVPRRGYLLATSASCIAQAEFATPLPVASVADAAPLLPLPTANRPMLVVLPFENIGGDPNQCYLARGITADFVTDLTRFEDLHVVSPPAYARSSLASATSTSGWTIPKEASYLLSGSVRRSNGRIRVTVRLDDAQTGISLWAERYDRPLDELFALQEDLARRLPAHLVSHMERETTRRARRRPTNSLDAYDLCLRGRELHLRATEADTLAANEMFARAIELDPDYALAYSWQAYTVQRGFTQLWGRLRGREAATEALRLARRSLQIEPDSPFGLGIFAFVLLLNGRWEEALEMGRSAVRANPCAPEARLNYGRVLGHAGVPVEAERQIRLSLSLNPFPPPSWQAALGLVLFVAGRLDEALTELRFCAKRMPDYAACLQVLVAAAAESGRAEEARSAVRQLLHKNPTWTARQACEALSFRDPALVDRIRAGFRLGGMPEG
jgi:TolB-like protein